MLYHITIDDLFDYQQFYLENERQSILRIHDGNNLQYFDHREVLMYMLKILWFTKDDLKEFRSQIVKIQFINWEKEIETDEEYLKLYKGPVETEKVT